MRAIDLFAGPGGWDEGALTLGIRPLGIEWDDSACATRIAAGHLTVQADIAALDPDEFVPAGGHVDLLIASPPCPSFSVAGNRDGAKDMEVIHECVKELLRGVDRRDLWRARCADVRSLLVVEPLRWALALEPDYIALEQVPPVLDLWKLYARELEVRGYSTWAGVLSAEQYGVPQTRQRAFMLASRKGLAQPPRPTHQAYEPGVPAAEQFTLEGTLSAWVSMAEALGWAEHAGEDSRNRRAWPHERPSPTITTTRRSKEGGIVGRSLAAGEGENVGGWDWQLNTGRHWKKGGTRDDDAQSVDLDQPAPTITGADTQLQWRRTDLVGFPRLADGTPERTDDVVELDGVEYRERDLRLASEPAFTLTEKARSWQRWPTDPLELKGGDWPSRRPATTIAGDACVFQPGGHHEEGEQSKNAIVVTVEEAAVLQSFRPDYPWQGARQFEQVGNAVPPLLAQHVLEALLHA